MATITKRKGKKKGTYSYQARVRIKGYPPVVKSFKTSQDAKTWAAETERKITRDVYFEEEEATKHTLAEAIDRFLQDARNPDPTGYWHAEPQLKWFKRRIGHLKLSRVTPAVLSDYKRQLKNTVTCRGTIMSGANVNRHFSALSSVFRMASMEWMWCTDNPVRRIR